MSLILLNLKRVRLTIDWWLLNLFLDLVLVFTVYKGRKCLKISPTTKEIRPMRWNDNKSLLNLILCKCLFIGQVGILVYHLILMLVGSVLINLHIAHISNGQKQRRKLSFGCYRKKTAWRRFSQCSSFGHGSFLEFRFPWPQPQVATFLCFCFWNFVISLKFREATLIAIDRDQIGPNLQCHCV